MSRAASPEASWTHGVLVDQTPDQIVLALPGTDYQLHLRVDGEICCAGPNRRIAGLIHARARRVDIVHTGGRYIEPIYGRPRRLQGTIVQTDPAANTITVDCVCKFVCKLGVGQKATVFAEGMLVSFDIEPGAVFVPV